MTRGFCLLFFSLMLAASAGGQDSNGKTSESSHETAFGAVPLVRLIRDPHTESELGLSSLQRRLILELLERVDNPIWRLRDYPASKVAAQTKPLVSELELGISANLEDAQKARLKQIVRQIQSWRGIAEPEMAKELGLRNEQLTQLKSIFADSTEKQRVIQEGIKKAGGRSTEALQASLREAQERERSEVAKVLDAAQQKKLTELVGKPFEFSKLKHLWTKAPEFASSTQWLQSKPIHLTEQKGKVVVVHFFAFGCINCVHNYPWYREWAAKYSPSEVTLIGIHTPETTAEQSVKSLESKLKENKLTFPVAVDNDKSNWDAWGNTMWPSVYLIDKEGFVRTWWYGELDWQGAGGQKVMEQRIDELLKETPRQRGDAGGAK